MHNVADREGKFSKAERVSDVTRLAAQPPEFEYVSAKKKIWVDLDNSPHVPFFRPIIEELQKKRYNILVTARDAYQVRELLELYGVSAKIVGKHYGKHKVLKAIGTLWRMLALLPIVRKENPDLAINHGSRGCLLTCFVLGIPNLMLADYEFTAKVPTIKPTWLMVPSVLANENIPVGSRILKYPGIKEDVYLSHFSPDRGLRSRLGILPETILITVRPPATEAHYHNPESEVLLTEVFRTFLPDPAIRILLLPRNKRQESELRSTCAESIKSGKILIPDHVEDGLNLIWNSDLVISGGGTMNREAAALGVPVYSIFRGKIGGVDRHLANQGRLVLLETAEDIRTKIKAERRSDLTQSVTNTRVPALQTIVQQVVAILGDDADLNHE